MMRSCSDPPTLDELIRRVARLRPCWTRPEAFFETRSDIVDDLRRLARQGGLESQARACAPSPRERRLEALARALASENARLQRLLQQAARPRRRQQRVSDRQQLSLKLNV
jgi:hypothetical protein